MAYLSSKYLAAQLTGYVSGECEDELKRGLGIAGRLVLVLDTDMVLIQHTTQEHKFAILLLRGIT